MAIGEAELNLIGEYVQSHLTGWMEHLGVRAPQDPVTNTQLLERVFRVEEELKAGREVMIARFEASDRRFESIDLRIGDLIKTVDECFRSAAKATDDRFADLIKTMDDRFNSLTKTMDDRFTSLDDRFAGINRHIGVVKWFVISSFVVLGSIISLVAILQ
ncbi:MAG: hypothetical protein V3S41_08715 [Spirochaetia bacterium]